MIRPIAFHPDLLPESSDEAGSTRYECMVMLVRLPDKYYACKCYDLIADEGIFMIIERSPDYKLPIEVTYKSGVAVRSQLGAWSWWFHL